jgi:predicted transcriptional regulator of viral defense system
LKAYCARVDRSDEKLIEYGERLGNGAVFKRLGFLAERLPNGAILAESCHGRLTAGNSKLDPALDGHQLVSRWRLLIPQNWSRGDSD